MFKTITSLFGIFALTAVANAGFEISHGSDLTIRYKFFQSDIDVNASHDLLITDIAGAVYLEAQNGHEIEVYEDDPELLYVSPDRTIAVYEYPADDIVINEWGGLGVLTIEDMHMSNVADDIRVAGFHTVNLDNVHCSRYSHSSLVVKAGSINLLNCYIRDNAYLSSVVNPYDRYGTGGTIKMELSTVAGVLSTTNVTMVELTNCMIDEELSIVNSRTVNLFGWISCGRTKMRLSDYQDIITVEGYVNLPSDFGQVDIHGGKGYDIIYQSPHAHFTNSNTTSIEKID